MPRRRASETNLDGIGDELHALHDRDVDLGVGGVDDWEEEDEPSPRLEGIPGEEDEVRCERSELVWPGRGIVCGSKRQVNARSNNKFRERETHIQAACDFPSRPADAPRERCRVYRAAERGPFDRAASLQRGLRREGRSRCWRAKNGRQLNFHQLRAQVSTHASNICEYRIGDLVTSKMSRSTMWSVVPYCLDEATMPKCESENEK